jgi:hypothetical protein
MSGGEWVIVIVGGFAALALLEGALWVGLMRLAQRRRRRRDARRELDRLRVGL